MHLHAHKCRIALNDGTRGDVNVRLCAWPRGRSSSQSLFRTDEGLEPFIGVIVSPYDDRQPTDVSSFQVLSMEMPQSMQSAALGTALGEPRRAENARGAR